MFRLLIIAAVVVVLALTWPGDFAPFDPQRAPDANESARHRQAVLDTRVRVEAAGQPLGDVLSHLAKEHGLPLELVETPGESWSTPISLQLHYPVRFEGLLELLQRQLRSFAWRWQGERLLLEQGVKDRPPIGAAWAPTHLGYMPDLAAVARSFEPGRELTFGEVLLLSLPESIAHTANVYTPQHENALRQVREREVWEPVIIARTPEAGLARQAVERALARELTLDLHRTPLGQALQQVQAALAVNVVLDLSPTESVLLNAPVSFRGRDSGIRVLRRLVQPLKLSVYVRQTGVIVSNQVRLADERLLCVYPLSPYLPPGTRFDARDLLGAMKIAVPKMNYDDRWGPPVEADLYPHPAGAITLDLADEVHEELTTFFAGLAALQTPGAATCFPAFDATLTEALHRPEPIPQEQVPLGEFVARLSRQFGITVYLDPHNERVDTQLYAGDGQGGTLAQQLDRLLLPRNLDYREAAGALHIAIRGPGEERSEARLYSLADLLHGDDPVPGDQLWARYGCEEVSGLTRYGHTRRIVASYAGRQPPPPRRRQDEGSLAGLRGLLLHLVTGQPAVREPDPEFEFVPGGFVLRKHQQVHRRMAALLDRTKPFAQTLRAYYQTANPQARAMVVQQALAGGDPFAAAFGVWHLTQAEEPANRPALLAAFTSGVFYRDFRTGRLGELAWEILRAANLHDAQLGAALVAMSQNAGPNIWANQTISNAQRRASPLLRRAAFEAFLCQEDWDTVFDLWRAGRDADPDCERARQAVFSAAAARGLAGLEEAQRAGNTVLVNELCQRLRLLCAARPAGWDELTHVLHPDSFRALGGPLQSSLYLELLRKCDPDVRRAACRAVKQGAGLEPEVWPALRNLLADPLVGAEAQRALERVGVD